MTTREGSPAKMVVKLSGVSYCYGKTRALDNIDLAFPTGKMCGLIGPDGVGKSTMLSLISGSRKVQDGTVEVLGNDIADDRHRTSLGPKIAYMPQGLGKNLYATLSVEENLQFFARLFGQGAAERRRRIDMLTDATGLKQFLDRPAGKLSGGMKQKLGLCCALIHDPSLLILDEPTTGVDPLARSQFWDLIAKVRKGQPDMSVLVATAYMDEAMCFDWLAAMDDGHVLSADAPRALLEKTGKDSLEAAFVDLMPEEKRQGYKPVKIEPVHEAGNHETAIEANGLTKRFGKFTAVDHVSFTIPRGEIFGFLGSNGSGKTTTMKMLTGLLPVSEGSAKLFGQPIDANDIKTRKRLGYMSQAFSLYEELSVEQNLVLHARLYGIPEDQIAEKARAMGRRFGLERDKDAMPNDLPLGVRQRLSLAAAVIHEPDILILDEPTSGVDPIARDDFWRLIIELSRHEGVTIFITTHFMNEAERCDRIALMHQGKTLAMGKPADLVKDRKARDLEKAFIGYLLDAGAGSEEGGDHSVTIIRTKQCGRTSEHAGSSTTVVRHEKEEMTALFSLQRLLTCAWRETLELARDPIRLTLALLGSIILMLVIGYGITLDVEDLKFAVLDRDQTMLSQNYSLNISGSRYFVKRPPLASYEELDRRMQSGDISLAVEIPNRFGRDAERGIPTQVAAWVDGSMPQRAETINGYVQGLHRGWLQEKAAANPNAGDSKTNATIETRYRYNPDVQSLTAMVPAVIPILLLTIPAILAALAIVREKELGSILNLYVTPLTRSEFMIGKQVPYIVLSMGSFLLLALMAVIVFNVPIKGSFSTLSLAALVYCMVSTGMGLLASTVTSSQISVMFLTMIGTLLPATQFAGLTHPVSSLQGTGHLIGVIYPTSHMLIITRGVFNKALTLTDLLNPLLALAVSIPIITGVGILLLKKQDG